MSVGNKILIVVAGFVVLLLAVLFIALPLFKRTPSTATPTIVTTPTNPADLQPLPADSQTTTTADGIVIPADLVEMTEQSQRAEIERLSRLFVERYGSYSNFSNFDNITSLKGLMTPSMQRYTQGIIDKGATQPASGYLGVSTRVISLTIKEFDAKKSALVAITVQEQTQDGLNASIQSRYVTANVNVLFSDNAWLVDGVYYQR